MLAAQRQNTSEPRKAKKVWSFPAFQALVPVMNILTRFDPFCGVLQKLRPRENRVNSLRSVTMETLRAFTALLGAVLTAISLVSSSAQAAEPEKTTVRVLMSPTGSGPYATWAVIQSNMEKFSPWLRVNAEETPGFNYNVKYLLEHPELYQKVVFGSGSVLDWAAKTGLKPFYEKPEKAAQDFRIIGVMGLSFNVWVTTDPKIVTVSDFGDKRVGIGMLTQNEWGMHQRMLLDGWGMTKRLKSLDTLGTSPNIDALLDGRTDVGTLFGLTSADHKITVVTGPHRQLEASNRTWHYVSVPPSMVEDYAKRTGAPFRVVKYPPNTLPKQPQELTTFGDLLLIEAHKSLPDKIAYELVRVLVKHNAEVSKINAFAKAWTPDTLAYGAAEHPELFHPGALKAYRDFGVLK